MSAESDSAASTAGLMSTCTEHGEWDLALELIPTAVTKSAPLYLLEAQAFHARAFVGNDLDGDMRRACNGAQKVIFMASADQALLAQALLLRANTLANLASRVKEFKDSLRVKEFKDSLGEATSAVQQAESVLRGLTEPDVANAYRIWGVINQTWHHLRPDAKWLRLAQRHFLQAIREFQKHGKRASGVPCRWNMYIILRSFNGAKAVSFLKRAVDLRAYAQGSEHPYTRRYHRLLQEERRLLQVRMDDAEMKQQVESALHEYDRFFGASS